MTASILAFTAFFALTAPLASTTTSSHAPVQQGLKKNTPATPLQASKPKDDAAAKDDNSLDTENFGTGSENETTTQTKQPESKPPVASPWETLKAQVPTAISAVNALFMGLLVAAFLLLKRDIRQRLHELKRQIERLEPKGDPMALALVRADLSKLQKSVDEARQTAANPPRFDMPRSSLVAPSRDPVFEDPYAARRDVPRFPILISDYLAQRSLRSVRVKATPLDAELFARDLNGEFFLVDEPDGGLYVVPAHENITTQFFKTYYRSSYDYTAQGSGDLYLIQPAQVSAKGDLWRLTSKGKLEVRAS